MPTITRIDGFRFFFFSNEGTEAPHVHIECGGKYAKFWIQPVKLSRNVGFNAAELNRLRILLFEHQKAFKERWDDYFQNQ